MKKPAIWFRLIIGDHYRRVARLTRLQRGALNDLIVAYFSEGQLPVEENELARLCEMNRKEWLQNRDAIKRAGQFMDDWRAEWIEAEMKDVENRRKQTEPGRAVIEKNRRAQPTQPQRNFPEKTDTNVVTQSQSDSTLQDKALRQGSDLYPGYSSPLDVERYGDGRGSTHEGNGAAEWSDDGGWVHPERRH